MEGRSEEDTQGELKAGAHGYVLKDFGREDIIRAIHAQVVVMV